MRKIITTTFITLDGVMQAPGGPNEDRQNGFDYGGWQFAWGEEDTVAADMMQKLMAEPTDMLLGKVTYDIFAGFWPKHKDEPHWGMAFDKAEKYVVTHKPFKPSWNHSTLITKDVVAEIKKLKKTKGPDLLVWGSGNLIQTLLKNHLIDRMHLWIYPLTIGTGKKLFAEGTLPERFKPVFQKITTTGVIFATYEPSTPLKKG